MRTILMLAAALALLLAPAVAIAQASPSPATSATRYDVMGRVTGTISSDPDAVGVGNPFLAVRNTYDTAGRPIKVETGTLAVWQSEAVAPANWPVGVNGFTVQQSIATLYDAMGRKLRDTLREGSAGTIRTVTQYGYNSAGLLECTAVRMNPAVFGSLPASACTHSTYDPALGRDRISRNVYDAAGQRLQVRVGVGVAGEEAAEATWDYNLNGQVTTLIDGNGNRAELRYDGHGRQDRCTFPSTTRPAAYNDATQETALATAGSVNANDYEGYSYDANGNRTNLRKRDTRNIVFAYDNLNRATSKTYPQGGATNVFYSYDLQGLQLTARFSSQAGEGITNAYDGFGRLATSSTSQGGTTRTIAYQYDRNGNRTRITHPDATYFQYGYDWLNRTNAIREPDNDLIVAPAYDAPGRPSSLSFLGGGMATNLTYDGVSRLSGLAHQLFGTAQDVTWTFARNAASQLASAARSNDAYAWTAHYAINRPYTTNGLNQYSAAGTAAFLYDANGNLNTDGTNTYTYDIENRLVSMNVVMTLAYDPLGRLYQTAGGPSGTTRYLYDGDALVAEYNTAGTLLRRYVHGVGADVPLVWYEGATLATRRHLHADHQGSIVAVGQPGAAALAVNTYDEYGIPSAANDGLFQYTGQIWLEDLGLYHYKARVYSPTLGRFLQTDPVGYEDQFNLYAYVGNDPLNGADSTGTLSERPMEGCGTRIRGGNQCSGMSGAEFGELIASSPEQGTHRPRENGGGGSSGDSYDESILGCESAMTCTMSRDDRVFLSEDMTREEYNERAQARAGGTILGAAILATRGLITTLFGRGATSWTMGRGHTALQWANRMSSRGWTPRQITEAIRGGRRFSAPNNPNPGNGATRFVHPRTGQSVVRDNVTGEIIHLGGPGYRY